MSDDFDLPAMFREHGDASYTSEQLEPTLQRLRAAVERVSERPVTAQDLAAAWTWIAELRLPRKAAPGAVLDEIEELVVAWGSHGMGGIAARAYSLNEEQREREAARMLGMLAITEAAAANAPPVPLVETE